MVFIRHHTVAKEVDEEEFFHSRETGGTVVSSALELMHDIMRERYPSAELEHLRRAGLGRRQLGRRLAALPGAAARQSILPLAAVLRLRRDRRPDEPQSLWHEYEAA